jgi:hypothetical protein
MTVGAIFQDQEFAMVQGLPMLTVAARRLVVDVF